MCFEKQQFFLADMFTRACPERAGVDNKDQQVFHRAIHRIELTSSFIQCAIFLHLLSYVFSKAADVIPLAYLEVELLAGRNQCLCLDLYCVWLSVPRE